MTDIRWTRIENLGVTTGSLADFLATYSNLAVSRDGNTMTVCDYFHDTLIVSIDGGANWEKLQLPILSGAYFGPVGSVAANDNYVACFSDDNYCVKYDFDTSSWTTLPFPDAGENGTGYVAYSEDAQHIISIYSAADYTIGISNDYGASWSTFSEPDKYIDGVAVNKTGTTMYATAHIGSPTWLADIYASYDYGENWSIINANIDISTTSTIRWVSTDDSGSKIVAIPQTPGTGWFSEDSGDSWVEKEVVPAGDLGASSDGGSLDLSTDGTSIVFVHWYCGAWTCPDFGDTWTERFPGSVARSTNWQGAQFIGTSNSNIMVINTLVFDPDDTGGILYPVCMSSDLGATWNYNAIYADFDITTQWLTASDKDGNNLLLANNNTDIDSVESILISHNRGTSWVYCALPVHSDTYMGLQISETGQYMIAISYLYGRIVFSNNSGVTWSRIYPPGVDVEIPDTLTGYGIGVGVWMSKTGQYILISRRNWEGSLVYRGYVSKDYGATWASVGSPVSGTSLKSINGDGSLMIAYSTSSLNISTDYSDSWSDVYSTVKTASGASTFTIRKACCDYNSNIYVLARTDATYSCMVSTDSGTSWQKKGTLADYTQWNDIVATYDNGIIFAPANDVTDRDVSLSLDSGIIWENVLDLTFSKTYKDIEFYDIDTNETGNRLITSTEAFAYIGIIGGRIKSIAGILFENISKVGRTPIANLKKISGEEN